MPKYLFTNDLRISELPSAISAAVKSIHNSSLWNDKSSGNNTSTLQFYFNLHPNTDIVKKTESDPLYAIRNFVKKFQFPNTRTKESFDDSIEEKTLLAPYRVIITLLLLMKKEYPNDISKLSLWEIMWFVFCTSISKNPKIDYKFLLSQILQSRRENLDLEKMSENVIQWKQHERQLREMLNILCYASKCFKYKNGILFFSNNNEYIKDQEYILSVVKYDKIWYPSDKYNYELSKEEYKKYMDTKDFAYSVINVNSFLIEEKSNQHVENTEYRPFITAIKSKPFLLLAGISGTGKSRIVRELARACWEEGSEEFKAQKPKNFEMVQVKPNWHDSSELIGYISRVSGSPVFVVGDFLKFVAKAWENPEVPYFLCLDEMNLAPVEQYFAEYLSVVESRKCQEDGTITTDPILKSDEQWYYDLTALLTNDYEIRKRFNSEGICIPQNLIVVGTVNMDETTFSFSRKVLDRAMTIEMNEVDLYGGLDSQYEKIGKLEASNLIGTAVEGVDVYKSNKDVCDLALKYLKAVNTELEGTPFKVAYRTRNEFLLYVVNNLPYNKDKDGNELEQNFVIARALDEITSMKILSRIEGDETKIDNLLDRLTTTIVEQLKAISEKEYSAKKDDGEKFYSVSLTKLKEMSDRLKSGYTSFWS